MKKYSEEKIAKILELEQEGLRANRNGNYKLAVVFFKELVEISPEFEHGMAFYNLASALEEEGCLKEAKEAYLKAIEYDSEDPIRLGGFASFLYLHGSCDEAFNAHLNLLQLERIIKDYSSAEETLEVLYELGEKIGWNKEEVQKAINEA